jgi:hypothetical protein
MLGASLNGQGKTKIVKINSPRPPLIAAAKVYEIYRTTRHLSLFRTTFLDHGERMCNPGRSRLCDYGQMWHIF